MKLTVGFSTNKNSFTSSLIRWWLGTPFSHTYLFFKIEEFESYTVFQAVGAGLQFVSDKTFLEENTIISEFAFEVTDEQYAKILNKCHEASGKPYGYMQNLGLVLARFLKLKKNLFKQNDNCSEWVAECLVTLDPQAFQDMDLNLVTPKDIYNYLNWKYNNGKN